MNEKEAIMNEKKEISKILGVPIAPKEPFCDYLLEPCKQWWYGVCSYELGDQEIPCLGCVHENEH